MIPAANSSALVLEDARLLQVVLSLDGTERDPVLHVGTLTVRGGGTEDDLSLQVGSHSVPVTPSTRCLQPTKEVYLFASEGSRTVNCLIVTAPSGSGEEQEDEASSSLSDLLQRSCNFQKGKALEDQGCPRLFGLSSAKIVESMASGTKEMCDGMRSAVKLFGHQMNHGVKSTSDGQLIKQDENGPVAINPWFYFLLHFASQKTGELKDGLHRVTSDSFLWLEGKLRSAGEDEEDEKGGFHRSESMRALGAVAGQALESFMDVADAFDDAAGDLCSSTAEVTTRFVRQTSGVEAAAATRQAFNSAGNVLICATGHKMVRRESVLRQSEPGGTLVSSKSAEQLLGDLNARLSFAGDSVSAGLRDALLQEDVEFLLRGCVEVQG